MSKGPNSSFKFLGFDTLDASSMLGSVVSDNRHQSHPDLIKRLQRAGGHLRNVIEMMTAGRDCADVAQQLHAVEKAVMAAKKLLIQEHLDHCFAEVGIGPKSSADAVSELKKLTKYL